MSKEPKSESGTMCLLRNLGFDQNFFEMVNQDVYIIKKCSLKKIFSESAVVKLPDEDHSILEKRKYFQEEDAELYREAESNWGFEEGETEKYGTKLVPQETDLYEKTGSKDKEKVGCSDALLQEMNLKIFRSCSQAQMAHLNEIFKEMNSSPKERHSVRAYKSKLKTKFFSIYERNSREFLEKVKDKMFLRCNYMGCNRTFASSGWLKAHFAEHIRELKKNKYNILFERFLHTVHHQSRAID